MYSLLPIQSLKYSFSYYFCNYTLYFCWLTCFFLSVTSYRKLLEGRKCDYSLPSFLNICTMSCVSSVYNIPVICKLKWLRNQDVELDFREPLSGNLTLFSMLVVLYRVIPLSIDLRGAVECLEVTSVESGLLVTWRNLWGQQHRKQGSTLVRPPLGGSDVGTSCPANCTRNLVPGPGGKNRYYEIYGPELASGDPLRNDREK